MTCLTRVFSKWLLDWLICVGAKFWLDSIHQAAICHAVCSGSTWLLTAQHSREYMCNDCQFCPLSSTCGHVILLWAKGKKNCDNISSRTKITQVFLSKTLFSGYHNKCFPLIPNVSSRVFGLHDVPRAYGVHTSTLHMSLYSYTLYSPYLHRMCHQWSLLPQILAGMGGLWIGDCIKTTMPSLACPVLTLPLSREQLSPLNTYGAYYDCTGYFSVEFHNMVVTYIIIGISSGEHMAKCKMLKKCPSYGCRHAAIMEYIILQIMETW